MSAQEWITLGIGLLALAYLVWRAARRRLASTCCGQPVCPATKAVLERLGQSAEGPTGPGRAGALTNDT